MLYAAIDIHERVFHAAVLDVETGETVERRFAATREELNDWAMPLEGRLAAVAIEATNGWRWVWRGRGGRGVAGRPGGPGQAEGAARPGRRARTGRRDACSARVCFL